MHSFQAPRNRILTDDAASSLNAFNLSIKLAVYKNNVVCTAAYEGSIIFEACLIWHPSFEIETAST